MICNSYLTIEAVFVCQGFSRFCFNFFGQCFAVFRGDCLWRAGALLCGDFCVGAGGPSVCRRGVASSAW